MNTPRMGNGFDEVVWAAVRAVPAGKVATYGQIALLVAQPRRARAVGRAMKSCPADVPWHRVVNARYTISDRPGDGPLEQRFLLEREGVEFNGVRIDRERFGWEPKPGARLAIDEAIAATPIPVWSPTVWPGCT